MRIITKACIIINAVLSVVYFQIGSAAIINVPDDYSSIQAAIDAAAAGDTVLVADGQYVERICFYGKAIHVASEFILDSDTLHIQNTIIDADTSLLGVADTASAVCFVYQEPANSIIQGFTIKNGLGTYINYHHRGGGILCFNSNPTIMNNIVSQNYADDGGGIAAYNGANPLIESNIIEYNEGHGISCYQSSPEINSNLIAHNDAEYGPGIFVFESEPLITNNIIRNNGTCLWGGGIMCIYCNPIIESNIIFANSAIDWGGGICCDDADPMIVNNTIANNVARGTGGGIYCLNDASPTIINTIVWTNSSPEVDTRSGGWPLITYSAIKGGWAGEGNLDDDPLFIAPYIGNYNICDTSPCIDAGDPSMTDPDGSRSDIGFYFPHHPECDIGKRIYIAINGSDTTGYGTPENPYRTIQHGVNLAFVGDTVIVENGTFNENVYICAKNIFLSSNYSFTGDTLDILNTVIDGNDVSSAITFEGCAYPAAISGFTIINGHGGFAGGILSSYSDLTITNNIITENVADACGGGIYCSYGSNIITNNIIEDNSARSGGGIHCYYSAPSTVACNIIRRNHVDHRGGGIYTSNVARESCIHNNLIIDNAAAMGGGGICLFGLGCLLINNTFSGNSAEDGGGVYCRYSDATLVNSIIWLNTAYNDSNEIYIDDNSAISITYSDINSHILGEGNIQADPLFRDANIGDYHLMATQYGYPYDSPCIDDGSPDIIDAILDSLWGLGTELSDMGAYGGCDSIQVGIVHQSSILPERFELRQNYPNPFNASTAFKFNLPKSSIVKLEIYDLLGRQVEILQLGKLNAGENSVTWNAKDLPSGVYFYRMQAGNDSESKKMILLR